MIIKFDSAENSGFSLCLKVNCLVTKTYFQNCCKVLCYSMKPFTGKIQKMIVLFIRDPDLTKNGQILLMKIVKTY